MIAMGRNKIDEHVRAEQAERITKLIEKSELNRSEIASIMGVDRSAITLWCNGGAFPRRDKLKKLAHILGTTDGFIKTGTDKNLDDQYQFDFNAYNLNAIQQKSRKGVEFLILCLILVDKKKIIS